MLRDQQPQAQQIAGGLIGEDLTDLAFDAARVGAHAPFCLSGALNLKGRGRIFGVEGIEFFFCTP